MSDFDVIVVGSGVAGAATSFQLSARGWRVAMLEQPLTYSGHESLSPAAARELVSMAIDVCSPLPDVIAWWGDNREHHTHPTDARVVQKKLLVACLRKRAAELGVHSFTFGSRFELQRADGLWRLRDFHPFSQTTLRSPYLVDATGRASIIGRRIGARRTTFDSLSSISFPIKNPRVVGVWTESTVDGWWNGCCKSNGGTLSFFSSPDVIRESRRNIGRYLERALHIGALFPLVQAASFVPVIRACSSSRLTPCAGAGWCAVGDAVWTAHPLASAGVAKAVRDASLVAQALQSSNPTYDRLQTTEFVSYLRQLKQHYALESRWKTSPFWRGRRFDDLASFASQEISP